MKKIGYVLCNWLSFGMVLINATTPCSFYIQEGLILQDSLLKSILVTSQSKCELKCKETSTCFSINYYYQQKKCHLNNATHLSRPLHLVNDMEGVYMKIKNDYCSDKYCSTGEICLIDDGNDDYNCKACNRPLGLESGRIGNRSFNASSYWGQGHEPWQARLRKQPKMPYYPDLDSASWQAKRANAGEYVQVDLGNIYRVTMVATQGRPYMYDAWVTKYSLSYAVNDENFIDYKVGGVLKVSQTTIHDKVGNKNSTFQKE